MNIGQKIKHFRERLGFTQQQLGHMIHVSESAIGNYETGKRQPSVEILRQITDALQVAMNDFFQEEKKRLLQIPMSYIDFRLWAEEFEDNLYYVGLEPHQFEYMMKSDRYFVELKHDYLIWLEDGFYLIPIEQEYALEDYDEVLQVENMRKVVQSDIPYIETALKRKITATYDATLFAEQVYTSKFDFSSSIASDKPSRMYIDTVQDIFRDVNGCLAYIYKFQTYYIQAKDGVYAIPIEEEENDEEDNRIPFVYTAEELYIEKHDIRKVTEKEIVDLQTFVLEEEYFLKKVYSLLEKEPNSYAQILSLSFSVIEENIEEWENKESFHPKDREILSYFYRCRIATLDNLKRIFRERDRKEESIFSKKWEEEADVKEQVWRKQEERKEKEDPKKYRILVVESGIFTGTILQGIVENHFDCRVYPEYNRKEAFKLYQTALENGRPFDLVTINLHLSEVDEDELLINIKRIHPEANVLMTASLVSEKTVIQAMEDGAKGFLSKPFVQENVVKYIRNLLEK